MTGTYSTGSNAAWKPLPTVHLQRGRPAADATVVIDPSQVRQRYTGLGMSLDETAVSNLWKLTPQNREKAIKLLADPRTGAGLDRFRLTIGSPDVIEHLPFASYDDNLPAGVTADPELTYFSIQRDIDQHIVDTARLILKYNPRATFFASAWSAPAWMKTNNLFRGESDGKGHQLGKLRDEYIDVFARYYVKYLQAYARQGIHIDAITMLNEPTIDVIYPGMDITWQQQQILAKAIKREFKAAHLPTQLWVFDYNFANWKDPNPNAKNLYRIFDDPGARAASDAIAFHPYSGNPVVMRDAAAEYHLPVHMTETSDLQPDTMLNFFRLNAGSYILWAQVTDQDGGTLHWTHSRDNNIDWDEVGRTTKWPDRMVKVNTETRTFSVRDELYQIGQISRYLDQGDVRIESSGPNGGVSNIAFRDQHDNWVTVVRNSNAAATRVRVVLDGRSFTEMVPAGAVATFRWHADVSPDPHNHAPTLAAVPDLTADQFSPLQVELHGADADRDRLTYYTSDAPDGVTVDPDTGRLTISATTSGIRNFTVTVTDNTASTSVPVHLTVRPHAAALGELIEAESYAGQSGWTEGSTQFVENVPAASGGHDVGYTAAGRWLTYRVDVPAAGRYDLELRVANGSGSTAPDAVSLRDTADKTLAIVSVPATGGWTTYQSIHTPVDLVVGDQLVKIFCETGNFNLDYLRIS
ncbi:carbohydrate-binding protein [Paractinoplanes toevensis]|uniref:carbohydrate-binding protein n=1 Tax=Paractinoplanes toevensis TaxID=571911 RepID=UPI001FEBF846|nr:carbohydrate-binding protein [Actinoplanes toevensis]